MPAGENEEEQVSIFIGTWNMGNTAPCDMSPWVPKGGGGYDILAIGVQESSYEGAVENVFSEMKRVADTAKVEATGTTGVPEVDDDDTICTIFRDHVGKQYECFAFERLLEIRLMMFASKEFLERSKIEKIKQAKEATGLAHILGNKGGVAVRFNIGRTSFCFVNSHLAAHQQFVQDRNSNVEEIMGGIATNRMFNENRILDLASQFHHCFWMGDLNYRLDLDSKSRSDKNGTFYSVKEMEVEENCVEKGLVLDISHSGHMYVKEAGKLAGMNTLKTGDIILEINSQDPPKVQDAMKILSGGAKLKIGQFETESVVENPENLQKKFMRRLSFSKKEEHKGEIVEMVMEGIKSPEGTSKLLKDDQLIKEMDAGNVFRGWTSLIPTFPPTFKVERGKRLVYKDKRIPSYCDRILHRSFPHFEKYLQAISFQGVPEVDSSDHKPVSAVFNVTLPAEKVHRMFSSGEGSDDMPVLRGSTAAPQETSPSSDKSISGPMGVTISLSNWKGKSLIAADINGKSDPYLIMYSFPEVFPPTISARKRDTLNPVWSHKDLKSLNTSFQTKNIEELEQVTIVLAIVDHDRFGQHDLMGQVIVPLKLGEHVFKDEPVLLCGKQAGTISGTLQCSEPLRRLGSKKRSSVDMTHGQACCSLS